MTSPVAASVTITLFDNYTKLPQRIPNSVWMLLRVTVLVLACAEIALLFLRPALGLQLFWAVVVPILPALFAVAPGLWRQICPMAFVNQLPRLLGFGRALTLPTGLRYWSYLIAIGVLIAMVSLRMPLLNGSGWATGTLCLVSLLLAFAGGLSFKGRSGWCGTFCPLAPVQRSHGQSPLIVVRNGYCPTCVGCQKNCFDFNPRAAIFADLNDADPRHVTQHMLFMSLLPGLIWGYYNSADVLQSGYGHYLLALVASMLISTGLFLMARALFLVSTYRMVTVFGASALLVYYYYAGPVLVNGVSALVGLTPADGLVQASRAIAVPIVFALWRATFAAEHAYQALESANIRVRVDDSRLEGKGGSAGGSILITERRSGKSFPVQGDKTLLEAMESAGVPIDFGCRSGLCGADAVGIVEGHEHLSAPGDEELATLRRMGLAGRARLACCARATGTVTIDCDPRQVPALVSAEPSAPRKDLAATAGVTRVVIVGNGIAGITVAELLRRDSDSVLISVVADEPHHFYNRMSLGRIIYNRSAMDGMFLVPESWYKDNRVTVWLNTMAMAIDRDARTVQLGTGDRLPYDRLVLATGASARPPGPGFTGFGNSFLLRTAADAQGIRAAVQRLAVRHAVVIGGGVLGVEAAEALNHLGLHVTLLHRGRRLMDRQLDAEGAQRLTAYLANKGIVTVTEAKVERFDGDSLLRTVRLEDGRVFTAELFLACAGIQPNTSLARDAGLEVGRGVRVDGRMQTSDAVILAVGDVAQPQGGGPTGLWPVAVEHGRLATAAILDQPSEMSTPRIVLQLKSDGIDLRCFGDIDTVPDGAEVLTAKSGGPAWWRLVVCDARVLGAVFVGPPGTSKELTRWLQTQIDVSTCLPALRKGELALVSCTGNTPG